MIRNRGRRALLWNVDKFNNYESVVSQDFVLQTMKTKFSIRFGCQVLQKTLVFGQTWKTLKKIVFGKVDS